MRRVQQITWIHLNVELLHRACVADLHTQQDNTATDMAWV